MMHGQQNIKIWSRVCVAVSILRFSESGSRVIWEL